ncbi:MAG TPA: helix-turn-helix transcriptional regulator [Candidatus Kurthia intestinigallinarum]|nr:helix-turn-helix transcriptional regulator [Candidatus Kurthia intestinigallinarum]
MITLEPNKTKRTNLKVLRAKHNVTQKDLARKLGVSPSTLSMIESGENTPSLELAYKIASIFGKSIEDIFFNEMKII